MEANEKKTKFVIILLFLLFITMSIIMGLIAFAKYINKNEHLMNIKFKNAMIQPPDIHLSTEEWTDDSVKVEIETDKKAKILYKIVEDGEDEESKEWIEYTEEFEIDKNCEILTKLEYKDGDGPVTKKEVKNIVVATTKIGDKVTGYESLQKAIDAAENNEAIVTLIKGVIEEGVTVAEDQNIELNLNGKTIKQEGMSLKNNGILTINGAGTIRGSSAELIINNGTLTKSGTSEIINESTSTYYSITNNGNFRMTEGKITGLGGIQNEADGSVDISGGTIEAKRTIIVNNSELNTESNPAVRIRGNVILKQESSETHVIANVKKGTILIEGGNIISSNSQYAGIVNYTEGKIIFIDGTMQFSGRTSCNL